jgi:hypothetical protein
MGYKRTHKQRMTRRQMGENGGAYQQSEALNSDIYANARNEMINIALTRFKWVNLPETCDERFLEFALLTQGYATIAFPSKQRYSWFSTQAVIDGGRQLNVYYNPSKWRSYGINGWSFYVNNNNGVFLYGNRARSSLLPMIDFYAHEIEDIYATKRMNRMHQKLPYILTVPPEQENAGTNLLKQIVGGELAVLATPQMTEDMKAAVLKTDVPYLGSELQTDIQNVWNAFYESFGIKSLPYKNERQTADEIQDYDEPTDLRALSELEARRDACQKLNNRFPEYFADRPINVVWREDNSSDNYNYINNIPAQESDDATE